MTRFIAAVLIAAELSGCAFSLGHGYADKGQTQEQLDIAIMRCEREADLSWHAGKQLGAFLLGFSMIGFPVAMVWERDDKRRVWRQCMRARGFRVTT